MSSTTTITKTGANMGAVNNLTLRMDSKSASPFMDMPAEIRLLIYSYLLDDGGNKTLSVHSLTEKRFREHTRRTRSKYRVLEQTLHRRCYETTYAIATEATEFHTSIMRVNHRIHDETTHLLYGKHIFDFGSSIEAVVPFLMDRTAHSRPLVDQISIYKRGPLPYLESDRYEWAHLCRFLSSSTDVKKLRLVVEGGRPNNPWDGPEELTESDFRLLTLVKHESLDWVTELSQVKGLEELEIVPDIQYFPAPRTTSMILFAAFSASIDKGLAQFLRNQLGLSLPD